MLEGVTGNRIALVQDVMRLTMQSKVTYGFLILAFGMMLTDCYRLLRSPSEVSMSAATSVQHARKF